MYFLELIIKILHYFHQTVSYNNYYKNIPLPLTMKLFSKKTNVSQISQIYLETQSKFKTEVIIRNQNYHEKETASLQNACNINCGSHEVKQGKRS